MTTTRAHILYFVPDLVAGQRFALGALVQAPGGTTFVAADHLPGAQCLGGPAAERLAQRLLERTACLHEPSSRQVAEVLGQFAKLGEPIGIPDGVASPERWLREHVLPGKGPVGTGPSRRRREKEGMRFLTSRHVNHYVETRFSAVEHWGQSQQVPWLHAANATHWVDGNQTLLFMEPVLVREDRTDLGPIVSRLMALDSVLNHMRQRDQHRLVAYVLPGGPIAHRQSVLTELRQGSAEVYDVSRPQEADELVHNVREIAALHPDFALN